MRAIFALLIVFLSLPAYAQLGGGQNTLRGQAPETQISATVQGAGHHVDGGTAVSLILKNTSPTPARFQLVEFFGVSPILILPNGNTSNGVFQGIEACSVPASGCMARRDGWINLKPNEDMMVAIAFRQLPYVSGRASLTLQIVQDVDNKRSAVLVNVRSVTLP